MGNFCGEDASLAALADPDTEEWARNGIAVRRDEWARFGHDWAHFGIENLNYDHFGAKVPLNYFGGELNIAHNADGSVVITHQPHGEFAGESPIPPQTLSDFGKRIKMGWAKLTGRPV
jgi:hypothetical protein